MKCKYCGAQFSNYDEEKEEVVNFEEDLEDMEEE